MDHLVLIPQDFNLVVTSEKLPQDNVTVWSNQRIAQGTIYYPFQGTVRIDKLNVFSTASDDDVSWLSVQSFMRTELYVIERNYEFCSFFLFVFKLVSFLRNVKGALKKFVLKKVTLPWLWEKVLVKRNFLRKITKP